MRKPLEEGFALVAHALRRPSKESRRRSEGRVLDAAGPSRPSVEILPG